MTDATTKIVADLRVLLSDAEDLLKALAAEGGEKFAGVRARLQQTVAEVRPRLAAAEAALEAKARAAAKTTDDYVHAKPWTAVGIAAGIGLVIGMTASRR